jgi:nicotinamidase-related amidase
MLREKHIHQIVLCGIETHVCVWQTAMDLVHAGFSVCIVEDAISSRHPENKRIAINRLRALGIQIAGVEMVLFELLQTAEHPNFKEIQALIK